MNAFRSGGRGSLILKKSIKGVGMIRRATGAGSQQEFDAIMEMVEQMARWGERYLDVLRAIKTGDLLLKEVYAEHVKPGGNVLRLLAKESKSAWTVWDKWTDGLAHDYSAAYVKSLKQTRNILSELVPECAIDQLPFALSVLREHLAGHAHQAFNHRRHHVQSFLHRNGFLRTDVYHQVSDIEELDPELTRQVKRKPLLMPDDLRDLCGKMPAAHADMAWTLAFTGMRPWSEYVPGN